MILERKKNIIAFSNNKHCTKVKSKHSALLIYKQYTIFKDKSKQFSFLLAMNNSTATATVGEIVAVPLSEFDVSKLTFSEIKNREWSWKDSSGKEITKKTTFVNVQYDGGNGLYLTLPEGSRTNGGVRVSQNYKNGFMSLNLSETQASELKAVDEAFGDLIFANVAKMLPSKVKMLSSRKFLDVLFRAMVQSGGVKGTGNDGKAEYWPDQLTATVPTKRVKQQVSVDPLSITIEDRNGIPVASDQIAGKTFKEVVIHVDTVKIEPDSIRLQCTYRYLVVDEVAIQKVVTRRKVDQRVQLAKKTNSEQPSQSINPPSDLPVYVPPAMSVRIENNPVVVESTASRENIAHGATTGGKVGFEEPVAKRMKKSAN
jgi:Mor family transcriptional regulator